MAYPGVNYCNLKNTQTAMEIGGHITLKSCMTPGVLSQKCMTELQRKKKALQHIKIHKRNFIGQGNVGIGNVQCMKITETPHL